MSFMDIEITDYKYKSVCDVRRCNNRSQRSIGTPGEPHSTRFIVCDEHLKGIILKGIPVIADQYGDGFLKEVRDIMPADPEIERLKMELEAAESEIKRLSVELQYKATKNANKTQGGKAADGRVKDGESNKQDQKGVSQKGSSKK
jgi:hypothetical protein